MAASLLAASPSSSPSCTLKHTNPTLPKPPHNCLPFPSSSHFPCVGLLLKRPILKRACAVVDDETWVANEMAKENEIGSEITEEFVDDVGGQQLENPSNKQTRPCQLYVCNMPRRFDIPDLLAMFQPFGTVLSIEVSKNPDTGVSRGCGYVTMTSVDSAKSAINKLDGSDVDGREMRVRYSAEINSSTRDPSLSYAAPRRNMIYESPYKIYVGNLPWATKPEDMRNLCSQFGTVVSSRIMHDRKGGKKRVYAFLSFQSASERDASIVLDGTDFHGRKIVVREPREKLSS